MPPGTPQEYVQSAVRAGLREYGISDHAPMQEEPFDDWRMKQADMGAYLDWIREATELAAPHGLTVKAGLECDWFPGIEPWTDHLRGLYEWDYLIGSVHYLGEKEEFDNPYKMDFWNTTDVEDAWEQYWKRFRDMAASGLFHILGHADLIKKFGFRPGGDLRRYYEPALEAISRVRGLSGDQYCRMVQQVRRTVPGRTFPAAGRRDGYSPDHQFGCPRSGKRRPGF